MATEQLLTSRFPNSSCDYAGGCDDQTSGTGSSSNPPLRQNYEVFLSFSGEDTRRGFTDHLYHRLVDRGIEVFRDNENLSMGQKIDQLLEAITVSEVLVPIISTHYASSEWCLRELLQILKCNKLSARLVLPIFYKVKPSDVRDQKGQFGEEFQRFKEKHSKDSKLVQEMEQAFKDIVSLKGWESDKFADGHEGGLVKAVVTRIFNELGKHVLYVPDYLVGVEERVKKIMKMIHAKKSNDAKIIAIHGMGGIGKTTLAKILYNKLSDRFDNRSFVPNIREASSKHKGMEDLQKQVISDVLVNKSCREISHVDDGITIMEKSFKGKRLLLLLDDVDDKDQLKNLAVKNNWYEPESIVIITTRNKNITEASAVNLSYELNELDSNQSYELFCKHAFRGGASCPSNLKHIARAIVSTTGGLPLAIEIIGSLLYQKSEGFWSTTLEKLRRIPENRVLERLMLSYEALSYRQQQIFLDIACLPIRHMCRYAFYMWDAYGFYPKVEIEILISLSLIKIRGDEIVMHDQLRDLGREIVHREGHKEGHNNIGFCSRLWLQEEVIEVLEQKQGTNNIQALLLDTSPDRGVPFTSQQFVGMEKLRFLCMNHVQLTGDFENLFSNIIWLMWGSICKWIDFMRINFNPKKLVILQLYDTDITEHWKGWSQVKNLKVLALQGCANLTTTPDFSAVEGLEELVLHECSGLIKIHPSIGKFRKTLKVLDVQECHNLKELPIQVGEMEELRELYIDMTDIRGIPISEGYMTKLHTLIASHCRRLEYIPEAIGKLKLLTHLNLSHTGVTQLPDSIGNLYNLESLRIFGTPLKCLPASIEMLSKLQELDLNWCEELESLPNLPCGLTSLRFSGDSMETLPDISNLTNLHHLLYSDVFKRRNRALNLTKLNQLETLEITHSKWRKWYELDELDEASEDINLLLELPLGLEQLTVCGCQTLRTFPNLSNLKNLYRLTLEDCSELNCLELEGAESLTHLCIKKCRKLSKLSGVGTNALQSFPNLSALKKLKHLEISICSNLVELQGLKDVVGLEILLELPLGLEKLTVCGCQTLQTFPNLSNLKNLSWLTLEDNSELNCLELEGAESLSHLCIKKCRKLSKLSGVGTMVVDLSLESLDALQSLPNLSALKKLKHLEISICSNLVEIQGLEDIDGLEILKIKNCPSFERIANLSHMKMLKTLELQDCEKLNNVQGIEELTSLIQLTISKPLQDSLDLSQLTNLPSLELLTRQTGEESQSELSLEEEEESQSDLNHWSRMRDKMTCAILRCLCW